MEVSLEIVRQEIVEICRKFNWPISPRPFQIDFFVKAIAGLSGFLEVQNFAGTNFLLISFIFLGSMWEREIHAVSTFAIYFEDI